MRRRIAASASRPTPPASSRRSSEPSGAMSMRTIRHWPRTRAGSPVRASSTRPSATWTRSRTAAEVVAILREHRVPVSRINSIADIAADPQFLARDMIVEVSDDSARSAAARSGRRAEARPERPGRSRRWPSRSEHRPTPFARVTSPKTEVGRRIPGDRVQRLGRRVGRSFTRSADRSHPTTSGSLSSTSTSSSGTRSWRRTCRMPSGTRHGPSRPPSASSPTLHGLGVRTVVDLTVPGLGRDVSLVAEVARRVPINLVAATGWYTPNVLPTYFQLPRARAA